MSRAPAVAEAPAPGGRQVIHVVLSRTDGLPRDPLGRHTSPGGLSLLRSAVQQVRDSGTETTGHGRLLPAPLGGALPGDVREGCPPPLHFPARSPDGRWHWPAAGWYASVSHSGARGAVALTRGGWVGIDVQHELPRRHALSRLGSLLGHPAGRPASIREWAEAEALLKAQGRAGRRPERLAPLPSWHPGWRQTVAGWWICSVPLSRSGTQLALAARHPYPVAAQPFPSDGPPGTVAPGQPEGPA
ncbi:hypothetical protein QOM21_35375 [Streptomyces sp. Pv4-95]|uniref:hypothetical protein n=1 Tax=Streptomyces sp. Pv4-95 TaxID=3049543 RepID=UPI003891BB5A